MGRRRGGGKRHRGGRGGGRGGGARSARAAISQQTLNILENGFYVNNESENVDVSELHSFSVDNSVLYKPEELVKVVLPEGWEEDGKQDVGGVETVIEAINCTTLAAATAVLKSQPEADIGVLNFASAKNPGGGFLKGSQAQEESLARSSGLYDTLKKHGRYYEENRKTHDGYYTDYMIYSPKVPVFRDDNDQLLDAPYTISVITAPAVNAGVVFKREEDEEKAGRIVRSKMEARIDRVFKCAIAHGHKILILGAFGCGVFRNDPGVVASIFKGFLETKYKNVFEKIVFAVLDKDKGPNVTKEM